jgi:purine-cytosine permease-like protein
LANTWCYALGVLVVSVSAPDASLVTALLVAQGGLLALGLILLDELDNAYGDVYSAAVSGNSLLSRVSVRAWGLAIALVCTGLALVLPMHELEPFLLKLSSIFVPLYGVILGRLALGGLARPASDRRVDWAAAAIWVLGVALFQALHAWAPQWGASLPVLAVTFALARLTQAKA